jgi:transposase-like protein
MQEYPANLMGFDAVFHSEEACREYLAKIRWPDGFRCPQCNHAKAWITARKLYHCASCGHDASLTAGTVFQDTHKPLMMWFRAMWFVTRQKTGVSAMNLQQELGLGSYGTAWTWLHKLRRAMVCPGRDLLSGSIDVDESYWGSEEEGMIGRQTEAKALIAVAVESTGGKIGRIRMKRIPDASSKSLHGFIAEMIEPNRVIYTDGWSGYSGLKGYTHHRLIQRKKATEEDLLPRVHQVISLLKRWLLGTHQGAIGHTHLDYYLDEFTFRFNRRNSKSRGKLFYRLLQQAVQVKPVTYDQIVGGKVDENNASQQE